MRNIFNYVDRPSPIHRLTGAAKLVCLLLWSFAAMTTYDTRLLVFLTLLSLAQTALISFCLCARQDLPEVLFELLCAEREDRNVLAFREVSDKVADRVKSLFLLHSHCDQH